MTIREIAIIFLLSAAAFFPAAAYNDYRVGKLDSLERVVARWTPDRIDRAGQEQLKDLNNACRDLMRGYNNYNGDKAVFYARRALAISQPRDWHYADMDALRYIGLYFYGRSEYDSAIVYFNAAVAAADKMVPGGGPAVNPGGYSEENIDDAYSMLYGTLGNLYNMKGDISKAMEYYSRAGEIFDKHGWNESNCILHYNIGETLLDEGDRNGAEKYYAKAMHYAEMSGDSMMVATAMKGYGRLYLEKGRPWKALRCIHKADEYFSRHDLEEAVARKENFEHMTIALKEQRHLLAWLLAVVTLACLLAVGMLLLSERLRRSLKQQAETSEVMEEALADLQQSRAPSGSCTPDVSGREKDIMDLLSKGYTTPQIAGALFLSPETVKWYRKKLLVKFDVANTAELVLKAKESGVLD